MSRTIPPLVLLAGCGLVFFWPLVLHPGWVLYSDHSDLISQHLPLKHFVVRSYQETGELPLWCPYQYSGIPVVHDIQSQALYLPHWLLLLLPESLVGAGMSWLLVGHVVLAGWAMFAYARHAGLSHTAAFVAGLGYMFAGKWMLHLLLGGQYVVIGLAWLPLVVLCLERGIQGASLTWATAGGVVLSLLVLSTHPQWTFYAGVLAGLWTFGAALERGGYLAGQGSRSPRRMAVAVAVWLGVGAWAVLVAVGLSAVQLLPTLEMSRLACRGEGVEVAGGAQFYHPVGTLLGPSPTDNHWEERTGLTGLGLLLALLAPIVGGSRVRFHFFITALLFAAAHGLIPFLQWLPGFQLFRLPGRLLIPAAFGVSLLAAESLEALWRGVPRRARRRCLTVLAAVTIVACVQVVLEAAGQRIRGQAFHPPAYWIWFPAALLVGAGLLRSRLRGGVATRGEVAAWVALLLADLWLLAWPIVAVRPESDFYTPAECVRSVMDRARPGDRVLDRGVRDVSQFTPLGTGTPLAPVHGIEAVNGYNPLDILRYKEYLQFLGGRDAPLEPFETVYTQQYSLDYPLREKPLLDLLGVRFVLQPNDPQQRQAHDDSALSGPGWRVAFVDESPAAYSETLGGVTPLPAYQVLENTTALPRAFVVGRAAPLPPRPDALATLRGTDFRSTVFLEGEDDFTPGAEPPDGYRAAEVVSYQPNRVVVRVPDGPSGWLVLTDIWYPGWECTVNGEVVPVRRADFLFRGVRVPAGASEVVFTYNPASVHRGKLVTGCALVLVVAVLVVAALRSRLSLRQPMPEKERS